MELDNGAPRTIMHLSKFQEFFHNVICNNPSLYFMSISAKLLGEDFEPKTPKSIKIVQNRRVNLKILANIKKN